MLTGPFRGLIRNARHTLNDFMKVGAHYYTMDNGTIGPIRDISVRVHDKFLRIGDLAGTNFHYAETEENAPRAIFMLAEIEPSKGFYISTQEGVYFIDSLQPPDDISVTANLARLSAKEAQKQGHPVYNELVKRVYIEASLPSMQ